MKVLNIEFLLKLDQLVSRVPLSMVSFGRTVSRNKAVGGADRSAHLRWEGADLVADTMADLTRAAQEAVLIGFSGIEVDLTSLHLHVDTKLRAAMWHIVHSRSGDSPLSQWLAKKSLDA